MSSQKTWLNIGTGWPGRWWSCCSWTRHLLLPWRCRSSPGVVDREALFPPTNCSPPCISALQFCPHPKWPRATQRPRDTSGTARRAHDGGYRGNRCGFPRPFRTLDYGERRAAERARASAGLRTPCFSLQSRGQVRETLGRDRLPPLPWLHDPAVPLSATARPPTAHRLPSARSEPLH